MKKLILILFVIIFSSNTVFAFDKKIQNNINQTNFINNDYLSYDTNSFKYNQKNDTYFIDVMEELDPGGDMENIKCPYGEGYITHIIYSTRYSPKRKYFKVKYKGFMCSIWEYEYENNKPISFSYIYKGVFYDNNTSRIPHFDMEYFDYLKTEINTPHEYNYFGFVPKIKNIKN